MIQNIFKDKSAEPSSVRLLKGLCVGGEGLAPREQRWECGVNTLTQRPCVLRSQVWPGNVGLE